MDDCNRALRLAPKSAAVLDSAGLVYLRTRQFDRSIARYDAALKLNPKAAWTLYCRGLAKNHACKTEQGATDIAAAIALEPHVAERAQRDGVD